MYIYLKQFIYILLIIFSGLSIDAVNAAESLVLEHVTIIDGTGRSLQRQMTIVISNGRIAAIAPDGMINLPTPNHRIDASDNS